MTKRKQSEGVVSAEVHVESAPPAPEPPTPPEPPAPQAPPVMPPFGPGTEVQPCDGGWHLVTSGGWQVSVAPDGLLMLPRHIHPREWEDFVAAGRAAIEVGARIIAQNEENGRADDRTLPSRRALVTEGGVPPGAVRMMTQAGSNPAPRAVGRNIRQSGAPAGAPGTVPRYGAPQARRPSPGAQ